MKVGKNYLYEGNYTGITLSHFTIRRVLHIGRLRITSPFNQCKKPLLIFKNILSLTT